MRQTKLRPSFGISHFRLERFACRKPVFDTQGAFFVHKELSEVVSGHHLSPLISSTKPSRRSDTHERKGGNDGAAGPIPRILAREPVLPGRYVQASQPEPPQGRGSSASARAVTDYLVSSSSQGSAGLSGASWASATFIASASAFLARHRT